MNISLIAKNIISSAIDEDILEILKHPTAPFREKRVAHAIEEWCSDNNISSFRDDFSNLWINASKAQDLQDIDLILVAHMDHPGVVVYEFIERNGRMYAVGDWLGGGPMNIAGSKICVFSNDGNRTLFGRVVKNTIKKDRPKKVLMRVETDSSADELNDMMPWGACIWFDLPNGYVKTDDVWKVRVADDLFMICVLLQAIKNGGISDRVKILFSRSEEKGELGSYFAAADTPISRKAKVISVDITAVENKSNLGKGVIIREKYKSGTYSDKLVKELEGVAKKCGCSYQKIPFPSKGDTDSTAFGDLGFEIATIAIPLWNYHNKKDGKKDGIPLPEIIDSRDAVALGLFLGKLIKGF